MRDGKSPHHSKAYTRVRSQTGTVAEARDHEGVGNDETPATGRLNEKFREVDISNIISNTTQRRPKVTSLLGVSAKNMQSSLETPAENDHTSLSKIQTISPMQASSEGSHAQGSMSAQRQPNQNNSSGKGGANLRAQPTLANSASLFSSPKGQHTTATSDHSSPAEAFIVPALEYHALPDGSGNAQHSGHTSVCSSHTRLLGEEIEDTQHSAGGNL